MFGLEVNWSLLQAKVALEADAEEKRKEQLRLDLVELNERRRQEKRRQSGATTDESEVDREATSVHSEESDSADEGHSDGPITPPIDPPVETSVSTMKTKSTILTEESSPHSHSSKASASGASKPDRKRSRTQSQSAETVFEDSHILDPSPPHVKGEDTLITVTDSLVST